MGGLFKQADPRSVLPRLCKQALETESASTPAMVETAARVGLPMSEAQKAALDYEQANVLWLALILEKKVDTKVLAPLAMPATASGIDLMKDTPRINWLRKGARWLYETNDEKAFEKLWDMASVPFEFPPDGAWKDFIMQWLMRLFNNITDLAPAPRRPLPVEIRIETVGNKLAARLFPDLPHLPERDKKELSSAIGGPIQAMLRGKIKV